MSSKRLFAWQCLKSSVVYENPWIKVRHDDVLNPRGGEGIYGVVEFKNVAVGVVALEDDHLWLVKQSRYAIGRETWEIPEGGAPLHEDPLEAAQRELREETGLSARCWQPILEMHLSNSVTDERACVYLATALSMGLPALEESEDITVEKIPFSTALSWIDEGKITDAITVAALLKVSKLCRENTLLP